MAKVIHRHAFVAVPLLRAIEHLPEIIEIDDIERAPIVAGFAAYRAHVTCGRATGWIDLSSAGTWRSEIGVRLAGMPAHKVERLLLALRAELLERAPAPAASTTDARMGVCRTA